MRICEWEGVRVLLTHGHGQGVSFGTEQLARVARQNGCTIALHGHTHIPAWERFGEDNLYLNPGSVSIPKEGSAHSYMVLEGDLAVWKDLDGQEYHREIL